MKKRLNFLVIIIFVTTSICAQDTAFINVLLDLTNEDPGQINAMKRHASEIIDISDELQYNEIHMKFWSVDKNGGKLLHSYKKTFDEECDGCQENNDCSSLCIEKISRNIIEKRKAMTKLDAYISDMYQEFSQDHNIPRSCIIPSIIQSLSSLYGISESAHKQLIIFSDLEENCHSSICNKSLFMKASNIATIKSQLQNCELKQYHVPGVKIDLMKFSSPEQKLTNLQLDELWKLVFKNLGYEYGKDVRPTFTTEELFRQF